MNKELVMRKLAALGYKPNTTGIKSLEVVNAPGQVTLVVLEDVNNDVALFVPGTFFDDEIETGIIGSDDDILEAVVGASGPPPLTMRQTLSKVQPITSKNPKAYPDQHTAWDDYLPVGVTREVVEINGRLFLKRLDDGRLFCEDGRWRDCDPCPNA